MNQYATEQRGYVELVARILCDPLPSTLPLHACYVVSETIDNQGSGICRARELYKSGIVERIAICGEGPRNGYEGVDYTLSLLGRFGRYVDDRILTPGTYHTYTEAESLVNYAQRNYWNSIAVTAVPFHQLRVFISVVSVALLNYPELKIYSTPGRSLDWTKVALHSQGTTRDTRRELLRGELDRIVTYHDDGKGNLASCEQILEYLNRRDS
jgi:hypothetical protein